MKYRLYFEFYGRHMTTEVEANSKVEAQRKVMDRIRFIEKPEEVNGEKPKDFKDVFNEIFGKNFF